LEGTVNIGEEVIAMRQIIIDDEVFDRFPDFRRGLIVVSDVENALSDEVISATLNGEMAKKIGVNLLDNEFVKAWDSVYLQLGSNPNKFPPSIKSLLKRVAKSGSFPFINSIVALFNYVSIKYLIPCGGDDVQKMEGNLRLGLSKGNEVFVPLGSESKEAPDAGEVIYFDDKTLNVMCRRWNWRNGDFTKILDTTRKLVINIDGIAPVPRSVIESARDELATLLTERCNAKLATDLLDAHKRVIDVAI
jgi:DNA/RNA-binding domain of Phe-tRNA-synthetase-like protein